MSEIEWKNEYSIGVEEIDFEHRIFVKIIRKIENAIQKESSERKVERLIQELIKYASFHFQSEENIMMDIKYANIVDHKKQHEQLLTRLQLVLLEIEIGQHNIATLPVFLIDWFRNHTLEEDKKLSSFILSV